ncbi:MAG TPA: cell wall-binding repeat-containing protein [Coriobacteriia bacterium]|jgi:hypothetical protein
MSAREALTRRRPGAGLLLRAALALALLQSAAAPWTPLRAEKAAAAPANTVYVRDLGATGDGVTNDSAAIQTAVKYGPTPRTVVFTPGRYVFSGVWVTGDTAMVFEQGATAVSPPGSTATDFFFAPVGNATAPVRNVRLEGGVFEGRPVIGGVVLATCVQNLSVDGIHSINVKKAVATNRSDHVLVTDCTAEHGLFGFAFQETTHVEVYRCSVRDTLRDGIIFYGRSSEITASENLVQEYMNEDWDGCAGIQMYGSTVGTITNNVVLDGRHNSAGIRFRDSEVFWCEGNYVVSPGGSGYQVHRLGDFPGLNGGNGTIIHNTVVLARLRAFDVPYPLLKPVRVIDNVALDTYSAFAGKAGIGILAVPSGSVVIGNRVLFSTGAGMHISGDSQVIGWNEVRDPASVRYGALAGLYASGAGEVLVSNILTDAYGHMNWGLLLYSGSALVRGNAISGATLSPYDIRGTQLASVRGDVTPPAVSLSVASRAPAEAVVRAAASDGRSPVAAIRVSVDGAPAGWYQGASADIPVRGEGTHTVTCSAADIAGNLSTPVSLTVVVDPGALAAVPTTTTAFFRGTLAGSLSPPSGEKVTLMAVVRDSSGLPVHSAAPVELEQQAAAGWVKVATVSASTDGAAVYTFTADTAATYRFRFAGDGALAASVSPPLKVTPIRYMTVAGLDRYATAIQISRSTFATASTVLVATGANFPDALGSAALAGACGAPILLARPGFPLSTQLTDEIRRLGARRAVILGSTSVVSWGIERSLRGMLGWGNVTRLGGADRYDTARKVAAATVSELAAKGTPFGGTAFVVTGAGFADAAVTAPVAYRAGCPIFLVGPAGLTQATRDSMAAAGVTRVYIVGSAASVGAATESALRSWLGAANVVRTSGANAPATSVAFGGLAESLGMRWDGLAISTSANFPDALAVAPLQARVGAVLLLTPPTGLDPAVASALRSRRGTISAVRFVGGLPAVPQAVRDAVAASLR